MGLLDVVGPVMVGPSSSHTAGACRLALLARHLLRAPPDRAHVTLHGSFAKTARGHGTDLALAAGLLGAFPDDVRIPDAFRHAREAGLEVEIDAADLGEVHPNTVRITLENDAESASLIGSSVGGGMVRVTDVNGFEIRFGGGHHTLLVRHLDRPGVIATVTRVIADDEANVATLHCARRKRGGEAMMSVEVDKPLAPHALDYLAQLAWVRWTRMLPEVLSGDRGAHPGTAGEGATA